MLVFQRILLYGTPTPVTLLIRVSLLSGLLGAIAMNDGGFCADDCMCYFRWGCNFRGDNENTELEVAVGDTQVERDWTAIVFDWKRFELMKWKPEWAWKGNGCGRCAPIEQLGILNENCIRWQTCATRLPPAEVAEVSDMGELTLHEPSP